MHSNRDCNTDLSEIPQIIVTNGIFGRDKFTINILDSQEAVFICSFPFFSILIIKSYIWI